MRRLVLFCSTSTRTTTTSTTAVIVTRTISRTFTTKTPLLLRVVSNTHNHLNSNPNSNKNINISIHNKRSRALCLTAVGSSMMIAPALLLARRCVHEQPFLELPRDVANDDAHKDAHDALVQLNVMVRRGIEPDALMYTALIATMARAGLEWQAYKLFSRMLEHHVRPMPETYVALHDATSPTRRRLRQELKQKMEEALETFPDEIAEAELSRQREQDRLCVQRFEEYMKGVLPPPSSSSQTGLKISSSNNDNNMNSENSSSSSTTSDGSATHGVSPSSSSVALSSTPSTSETGEETKGEEKGGVKPIATMHIRNPTDAWSIARMMEERRERDAQLPRGESTASLIAELERLHEEELRIFLAAQRQLRHGNKNELIQRVIDTVSEKSIRDMLARRKHYFRSVAHILENDLNAIRQGNDEANTNHSLSGITNFSTAESAATAVDRTLTAAEKDSVAPEVLYTPWGILRKPMKLPPDAINTGKKEREAERYREDRIDRIPLSADELLLVRRKAETGDLDELPGSLLRRYAAEFHLTWKRKHPLSLLEAVQWHSTTFLQLPNDNDKHIDHNNNQSKQEVKQRPVYPTPALRRQQEDEGVRRTLDNHEAFRIIAQRTNNLQVVDHKEINIQLKKLQREAQRKERRVEETLRREKNLLEAATLASSASSFRTPDAILSTTSHVLGISEENNNTHGHTSSVSDTNGYLTLPTTTTNSSSSTEGKEEKEEQYTNDKEEESSELPPWAIFSGEEEFDISTGRFGDPNMGRYQELSDGRFRILPSREAQEKWAVDRQLLPGPLQDKLQRAELQQQARVDAVEQEYTRKLQFKRYRKWDTFLRKAQGKQQKGHKADGNNNEDDENDDVRPLPPKRRLSQLLRKGRDKAPVDAALKAKFTKSL
ncbi:Pentatricopeptide repeat [Trypanosoma melophagium]|uniref:Pentatricopeptide repeat n=1 Tax=Trypanosoma melophagium TaxID=715481 RepID=UPI00351A51F3|nr:Pentatricopeptide repeat [Trypanosoma melophagium]